MSPQQPTHYEILSLPSSLQNLTTGAVKKAYHKALLHHHPDKSPLPSPSNPQKTQLKSTFSIDQITTAFTVLSDPAQRKKYDQELKNVNAEVAIGKVLQTVDLDDMEYCEEGQDGKGVWWRGCRCGEERGFVLTEEDLEDGEGEGEGEGGGGQVVVGCVGCSLWVRVVYGVVFDEGEEEEGGRGGEGF